MASKVAFVNIKEKELGAVQEAVRKAMNLADWKRHITGKSIFIKLNAMSAEVVPGQCTSPWVFEGVLQELREKLPDAKITFGDADSAIAKDQATKSVHAWHTKEIGEKYGAKFVNLTKLPAKKVNIGKVIGEVEMPIHLLEVDNIITIPVIKTHTLSTMTGALKNQWGLLPTIRGKFHPVLNHAIADINKFFSKLTFAVGDMSVAMEGTAPRTGRSKICNLILASPDRVALDTLASKYMGFDPYKIESIVNAEKFGVGTMDYKIVGDKFYVNPFSESNPKKQPVYLVRDIIKKIPIVSHIAFNTPVYKGLGQLAKFYNTRIWYYTAGKKNSRRICQDKLYGKEFGHLCK